MTMLEAHRLQPRLIGFATFALAVCVASTQFGASAIAAQKASKPIYVDGRGLAVGGFDVIEYLRANKAERGSASFVTTYLGAEFRFVSADNRDAFLQDPARYVPQFGGHCAYAISKGEVRKCDPRRFSVRDGKLYLFSSERVRKRWLTRETDLLAAALATWRKLFP